MIHLRLQKQCLFKRVKHARLAIWIIGVCREVSEQFIEDAVKKGGEATLIRVNPDTPFADDEAIAMHTIHVLIRSKRLRALEYIGRFNPQ